MSRAHGGFSLIELLIAVAIIGVLAALLIPAIAVVKASATASTCKSNLRQIFAAHIAYAGDWRGNLPPTSFAPPGTTLQVPWIQTISPYCDKSDTGGTALKTTDANFISPIMGCAALKSKVPGLMSDVMFAMGRGYLRNAVLQRDSVASWGNSDWNNSKLFTFRLSSITHTSRRLLVGDGLQNSGWGEAGFESAYARSAPANTADGLGWFYKHLWLNVAVDIGSDRTGVPWTKEYLSGDYHRGRRSYVMCDGSARSLTDDYRDPDNRLWVSISEPWKL